MINLMRAKRVTRNTILIDSIDSSTNMYILVDGRLRIFKTNEAFRTYRIVQNRKLRVGDSPKESPGLSAQWNQVLSEMAPPMKSSYVKDEVQRFFPSGEQPEAEIPVSPRTAAQRASFQNREKLFIQEFEEAQHGPSIREVKRGEEVGDFSCIKGLDYVKELVFVEEDSLLIEIGKKEVETLIKKIQGIQYHLQMIEFLKQTIVHFDKVSKVARERISNCFEEKVCAGFAVILLDFPDGPGAVPGGQAVPLCVHYQGGRGAAAVVEEPCRGQGGAAVLVPDQPRLHVEDAEQLQVRAEVEQGVDR